MKKYYLIVCSIALIALACSGTGQEEEVAQRVEAYRKAMIDADSAALGDIFSDQLSYGHSNGRIEDKKEAIDNMVTGFSDFVTMDLSDQSISISDNIAIVRNTLDGQTVDSGTPGEAHLLVLMVWHRKEGKWELLARQAVKRPVNP